MPIHTSEDTKRERRGKVQPQSYVCRVGLAHYDKCMMPNCGCSCHDKASQPLLQPAKRNYP